MKFQHLFLITVVLLSLPLHGVAQAQETQKRPIVKLIYFIPSDRAPQPDFDAKMDTLIKDVQTLFANQMEAHGFDRKTFLFETDTHGKAVVHHFVGQFTEEYYNNLSDTWDIFEEIEIRLKFNINASKDIYLVAIDTSRELIQSDEHGLVCGLAGVGGPRALVPAAGSCFNVDTVAHELGHVFGLDHGFYDSDIDNKPIFSYTSDRILASFLAADWWDVHPAFNPPRPAATNEYQSPTVEMLAPSLAAPPNVIRLRFEITDPNENLHQAQLMTSRGSSVYLAWQRLNGKPSEIVEFATTLLLSTDQTVYLRMIDTHGNITRSKGFPIDITPLLPPSETLSTVPINKGFASHVAYSPDGQRLAVAGGLGVWLHYTKIGDPPVLIKKEAAGIRSISISPDGQTLAIGNPYGVVLWDVRTTEPGLTLELPTFALDVSFSPDGRLLAIAGSNGTIYLWDVMTGELRHTIKRAHLGNCYSVAFSPDGQTLASGGVDNIVRLWDVSTAELRHELTGHTHWVQSVSFSPDGKTLASAGLETDVRLWDVMTGEPRQTITTGASWVWSVTFSPDGKTLASSTSDTAVRLWDVSTYELRYTLHGHTTLVNSISFSPDSKSLASVSAQDSIVNIWDVRTGERRQELTGYTGSVESMSFSPDSETLATVGEGKSFIDMWDVSTGILRQTLGHTRPVKSISFSPNGKTIASGGMGNAVRLWDVSTGALRQTLTTSPVWIVSTISFSPNGKTLASADTSGSQSTFNIRLWDVMTGELRYTLTTTAARNTDVSFSPDGKTLTGVNQDYTIGLWDVMTGEYRHTLTASVAQGADVSFSPDGKTLAGVNQDYTIGLWDVMTGEHRHTLPGHTEHVTKISFSPDGKTLASASFDSTIYFWDVMTGERRHTLRGHIASVYSISFSPDGQTLASGGFDYSGENNTLYLWDTASGELRHALTTNTPSVRTVLFSPDGQTLAITAGGTIRLWKVTPISSEPEKIKEDINTDGIVNIQDLVTVADALGQTGENDADVNGDGEVNIQDLVAVAAALGQDAAAPSALRQQATGQLTAADVQQWIELAQQLDLTAPRTQRGLLFLQYLLTVLTPKETALLANYPNPFNPETWIPYQLAKPADVTLTIYDIQGRVVRDLDLGHQRAGMYQSRARAAYWDGKNAVGESVASGVYFYTLTAGDFTATRKMLIRK